MGIDRLSVHHDSCTLNAGSVCYLLGRNKRGYVMILKEILESCGELTVWDLVVCQCANYCKSNGACSNPTCCPYKMGFVKPNYPVPAIVAGMTFGQQNGRFYHLYLEDREGGVVAEWFKDDNDMVTQVDWS